MTERETVPMWVLWRNKIDPTDLLILHELSEGTPESRIPGKIKDKFGISISRGRVRERIEALETKKVILKKKTVSLNPMKLHSNIYLAFIKTYLSRPAPIPSPPYTADIRAWTEAYDEILKVSNDFNNILRMLFNVGGTGEYDFVALIFTNDPEEYHRFKDAVVKRTGLIEKWDTKYVDVERLFHFDPVSVPDYVKYKDCLLKYYDILKHIKME